MRNTVVGVCVILLTLSGYVYGKTTATLNGGGGGKRLGSLNIRSFASSPRQDESSVTVESSRPFDTSKKLKFEGKREKTIDRVVYTYRGYQLDRVGGVWIDSGKRPFVLAIDKVEFDSTVENITIPDQIDGIPVVEIGVKSFQNCSRVKRVVLPKKILKIHNEAFDGCRALEILNGLDSCREIGC